MDIPKQQSGDQVPQENKMQPEQVILISSDQNQQPAEVNQQNQMDQVQFIPVAPPDRQERERMLSERRIKITDEIIRQNCIQTEEQKQLLEELRIKMQRRKQEALVQRQLHQLYPTHKFLPTPRLKYVKEQMQNYNKACIFEPVEYHRSYIDLRSKFRKMVTECLLLTIEEIRQRVKPPEQSDCQKKLILPQSDGLIYCYNVAKQLQIQMFTRLVLKPEKGVTNKYYQQTKIIQKQLEDNLHVAFRRNLLNCKADFPKIIYAKQQELKCQQRKKYELRQIQTLIRQHTTEPIRYRRQSESESEPTPPPPPPPPSLKNLQSVSVSSFASIPQPVDDTPKETPEERNAREKKELLQSLQNKIKRVDERFIKNIRQMERREQGLMQTYSQNQFFMSMFNNSRMSDD